MISQSHQPLSELGLTGELLDEDIPHPVVEDLPGNTAEVGKGPLMSVQKARHIATFEILAVGLPRETQHHAEHIKR